jgi:hypothetical protein
MSSSPDSGGSPPRGLSGPLRHFSRCSASQPCTARRRMECSSRMYPFRVRAAQLIAVRMDGASGERLTRLAEAALLSGAPVVIAALLVLLALRRTTRSHPLAGPFAGAVVALTGYVVVSMAVGGSWWLHYLVQLAVPGRACGGPCRRVGAAAGGPAARAGHDARPAWMGDRPGDAHGRLRPGHRPRDRPGRVPRRHGGVRARGRRRGGRVGSRLAVPLPVEPALAGPRPRNDRPRRDARGNACPRPGW